MPVLNLGQPYAVTAEQAAAEVGRALSSPDHTWIFDRWATNSVPPGMTLTAAAVSGTPTTAGEFFAYLTEDDGEGATYPSDKFPLTVQAAAEPEPEPIPDAEGVSLTVGDAFNRTADEVAASIGLTNGIGAVYEFDTVVSTPPPGTTLEWNRISGTVTTAGEYTLRVFFASDGVLHQQTNYRVRVLEPVIDPEPEEPSTPAWEDEVARAAVRYIGRPTGTAEAPSVDVDNALAQLPVVLAFVQAYTRGRGFDDIDTTGPDRAVRMVIVSALSRLVQNPEQVSYYSISDYTEKGSVLNGWTLPEQYVLNTYRRTWA